MFTIAPTDQDWFEYLKTSGLNSMVNFWTPTQWNPKQFEANSRLYFMLKSPIRKIGGWGEFIEYKPLTTSQAWNEFGFRNGCPSKSIFTNSIEEYVNKNSEVFGNQIVDVNSYQIGCIVLANCVFLEEHEYIDLEKTGISFASNITTLKYYHENDLISKKAIDPINFTLVIEPRNDERRETNMRKGQNEFKGKILKAYDNECCITGEYIPELLQAAHIQQYKSITSHHVQNGLLMRIDIHKLFDSGYIYIDNNYIIHISSLLRNTQYWQYNGKSMQLPRIEFNYPSKDALKTRLDNFRN